MVPHAVSNSFNFRPCTGLKAFKYVVHELAVKKSTVGLKMTPQRAIDGYSLCYGSFLYVNRK